MFKSFGFNFFEKASNQGRAEKAMRAAAKSPDFNVAEGLLPVLSATQLLKPHAALLSQINELAGVSMEAFQHFYLAAIHPFTRYVQQLPASEVHHHAGNGGLLAHSLEVCVLALRIRRSYLLSSQGGAEEIAKKQDLWTYAVFLGALCHDLAKPAIHQQTEIAARPGGDFKRWHPYGGFMDEQGAYYRTAFLQSVGFGQYQKATPLLVHHIIPGQGMQWLNSDPLILSQWLAAISGDPGNSLDIGAIITQADNQSVSSNLGGGSQSVATVRPKALHEKVLTSMRHLLASGRLPLNCQGGAAWVQGSDCWLVGKVAGEAIRAQLIHEQHGDAPTLNSQLFDVLQAHGVIMPCADKALWQVTIAGKGWQDNVTVLRIPVSTLWPNPASKPEDFAGEVLFEADNISMARDGDSMTALKAVMPDSSAFASALPSGCDGVGQILPEFMQPQLTGATAIDDVALSSVACLPAISTVSAKIENTKASTAQNNQQPLVETEQADNPVDAAAHLGQVAIQQSISPRPVEFNPPVTPKTKPVKALTEPTPDPGAASDKTDDFMAWLQPGIQRRSITVNDADAPVHVVPEGVLLVTPNIFKAYAKARGLSDWIPMQKVMLKKNWHLKTNGSNVFTYQVVGATKTSTVNGILFPDPALIFGASNIPKPNPHLNLLT